MWLQLWPHNPACSGLQGAVPAQFQQQQLTHKLKCQCRMCEECPRTQCATTMRNHKQSKCRQLAVFHSGLTTLITPKALVKPGNTTKRELHAHTCVPQAGARWAVHVLLCGAVPAAACLQLVSPCTAGLLVGVGVQTWQGVARAATHNRGWHGGHIHVKD